MSHIFVGVCDIWSKIDRCCNLCRPPVDISLSCRKICDTWTSKISTPGVHRYVYVANLSSTSMTLIVQTPRHIFVVQVSHIFVTTGGAYLCHQMSLSLSPGVANLDKDIRHLQMCILCPGGVKSMPPSHIFVSGVISLSTGVAYPCHQGVISLWVSHIFVWRCRISLSSRCRNLCHPGVAYLCHQVSYIFVIQVSHICNQGRISLSSRHLSSRYRISLSRCRYLCHQVSHIFITQVSHIYMYDKGVDISLSSRCQISLSSRCHKIFVVQVTKHIFDMTKIYFVTRCRISLSPGVDIFVDKVSHIFDVKDVAYLVVKVSRYLCHPSVRISLSSKCAPHLDDKDMRHWTTKCSIPLSTKYLDIWSSRCRDIFVDKVCISLSIQMSHIFVDKVSISLSTRCRICFVTWTTKICRQVSTNLCHPPVAYLCRPGVAYLCHPGVNTFVDQDMHIFTKYRIS